MPVTQLLAGSSAFAALIWWVVPATGLVGAIGYVIWSRNISRNLNPKLRVQ